MRASRRILFSWMAVPTLAFMVATLEARQVTSPGSSPATYDSANGPIIAIDQAHQNTHAFSTPSFRGLVELLRADGYRVRPFADSITTSSLTGIDVLLLSGPGGWLTPDEALTDREVDVLIRWIKAGGSLLLILDHTPAPRNSARLTSALGVRSWHNGYALVAVADSQPIGPIIFWRAESFPADAPAIGPTGPGGGKGYQGPDAILAKHPITEGRNENERVRRVATFVGSAFQPSPEAEVLLTLPRRAVSFTPPETPNELPVINAATPHVPVGGWVQGAVMGLGRGRVALFGETGLFSGGPAADNRGFVLNVMHWLTGLLPAR